MANFLDLIAAEAKKVFADSPSPPGVLKRSQGQIENLSMLSFSDTGDIENWLQKWKAVFNSIELRETILVRLLQRHLPRVAETLTFLGIIAFHYDANGDLDFFKIRWKSTAGEPPGLADFMDPDKAKDPVTWLGFLNGRLGSTLEEAQLNIKILQALFGLLLVSPTELLRLEYSKQGFTSLPKPADSEPEDLVDLIELLENINSPLRIALTSSLKPAGTYPSLAALVNATEGAVAPNALWIDGPDSPGLGAFSRLSGLGVELQLADPQAYLSASLPLVLGWSLSTQTLDPTAAKVGLRLNGAGRWDVSGLPERLRVDLARSTEPTVFGDAKRSHVSVNRLGFSWTVGTNSTPPSAIGLSIQGVSIVLSPVDFAAGIPGLSGVPTLKFQSDFNPTFDSVNGWNMMPELAFEQFVPIGIDLGPIKIPTVRIRLGASVEETGISFSLNSSANVAGELGPVRLTMEGVGMTLRWNCKSASPLEFEANMLRGIGLSIAASPIEGGGYIQRLGPDEYGGALSLKLLGIGISAFGIYKKMPNGDPSFIALLGIRFPLPGIQLSWGFALSGVGGLIGINRRANTSLLRERLSSGAAGNVLFNDNPSANAPALIHDLREFFPDEAGVFVIGPTLQITWGGNLISLDLGVFIELPGPRQIFIAGSLRVLIGKDPTIALVFLRLDFIGGVDFTCSLIYFDAALVHSHVMQVFRITGGAALRINYGDNGFFLLTVGGFNTSFNPGALVLPKVARAGAYLSADLGVKAWMKMEAYFAVTPNTVQVGSGIEAGLEIGPLRARGWFRFDALIQFDPFYFEAGIDAGFDVSVKGVTLCGVRIEGMLSGPGPIVIRARASVKILFVRISGSVTLRLGTSQPQGQERIGDLLGRLTPRLKNPDNSSIRCLGEDRWVILKPEKEREPRKLISPCGPLVWEQRMVPFGRDLSRFDGVPLIAPSHLEVNVTNRSFGRETDWFSAGTYTEMSQADKLNTARFAEEQSGVIIGTPGVVMGAAGSYEPKMHLIKITRGRISRIPSAAVLMSWRDGLCDFRSERRGFVPPSARADGPIVDGKFPRPKVLPDRWSAQDGNGKSLTSGPVSPVQAWSVARAPKRKGTGAMALHVTDQPVDITAALQ